jgi:serine/threonine-protein kinase RsbW
VNPAHSAGVGAPQEQEFVTVSTTEGIPSQAKPADDHVVAAPEPTRDVVSVRLPASPAYLAVLRTTTASLAARLDFTIDEIEDLRIAVDEASCLLLADAEPDTDLVCEFELHADALRIAVSASTSDRAALERDSFAWTVLAALAGDVDAWTDSDGRQTIAMVKHRSRQVSA